MWEARRDKKQNGTISALDLYGDFFNRDGITRQDGMIFVPPFSSMDYLKGSIIFSCWQKLLIKLLFQIQYVSSTQVFQFFWTISYVKLKALVYLNIYDEMF